MTERDDTLEEIACYIDDSKEAAQRMGKHPLVAALEVMAEEVRSRKRTPSSVSEKRETFDDLPLRCEAIGGVLDMRIGEKVLAFATENCPDLWDREKDRGRFKVTDSAAFAKEVERALNHESEDGSTMLSRMLDAAVLEAIEQGAEGVEGE